MPRSSRSVLTPALLALDSHRAFADRLPSLAQEAQRKAMANLPATAYTTPTASPASQRSMRSAGTAGKPSPESAAEMGAPPTPKRRQPSSRQPPARGDPPSRGAKQQAATGAQPPPSNSSMPPPPPRAPSNAWKSGQGWIGRKQQAAARDVTASSAGAADDRMDISFPLLRLVQPTSSSPPMQQLPLLPTRHRGPIRSCAGSQP